MNRKRVYLFILGLLIFVMELAYSKTEIKYISARSGHTAIYDPENNQMIVFGGGGKKSALSDTWVFAIETKEWKKVDTKKSPPARSCHSAVYDSANKQMIIFGGVGQGATLSDTWIYNIEKKEWREISLKGKNAPHARYFHSAIYDSANKQMLVFGGHYKLKRGEPFSDMWSFDIKEEEWEEIKPVAGDFPPSQMTSHSAIYDGANKKMIVLGGVGTNNSNSPSSLWIFDMENSEWEEIDILENLAGEGRDFVKTHHSAIYDSVNKQMIVYGGLDKGGNLSYLWTYDISKKKWNRVEITEVIPQLTNHSAVYDEGRKEMIIFGGADIQAVKSSDTWIFNIEEKEWRRIKTNGTKAILVLYNNKPIETAGIEVKQEGKLIASGITDKEGKYELTDKEGEYEIIIKKDGYNEHTQEVEVRSNKKEKITVNLVK